MREWLSDESVLNDMARYLARLADAGAKTGRGWLVPKGAGPIYEKDVPEKYVLGVNWEGLTDRELGLVYGEPAVLQLLNDRIIFPEEARPFYFLKRKTDQYCGRDVSNGMLVLEIKVERVISDNLFVQTHEFGHDVHSTPEGERRVVPDAEVFESESHFCEVCGDFAYWGYHVSLRSGKPGEWYCDKHRPDRKEPVNERPTSGISGA